MKWAWYRVFIFAALTHLFAAGCSTIPAIPAQGEAFGQHVETTVDSEVARYYLENYLPGKQDNPDLDRKISSVYDQHKSTPISREALKSLSLQYSVDFASLFFADSLLSDTCNKALNQSFVHFLNHDVDVDRSELSSYVVLFVPGWDHVENGPITGADFAKPRELATAFGLENYLVELFPTGSVEENADVLASTILHHSHSDRKIILAGASSAGPVIHLTLGERLNRQQLHAVKAWLNLGGILQGSPLLDYLQQPPQHWIFELVAWFQDWDTNAVMSMSVTPSRERFSRLKADADIFVVNYLGVPLSGQLSRFSTDKYPLLSPEGPNDGLTLLADAIAPNSLTIVALGSDHFFAEDPAIDEKTIALMKLMISYLEKNTTPSC